MTAMLEVKSKYPMWCCIVTEYDNYFYYYYIITYVI